MKFMKLGSRPDTFFTAESIRSVASEVSTDIKIQVQNNFYHLHKFPLLSKSGRLQTLCAKDSAVYLSDIPGGADAFELCAKFCYGIGITVSPLNFVPLRCAAEYLVMTDAVDRGNLVGKLESFFKSCILRRWKDTLITLQSTRLCPSLCEDLRITGRCIEALSGAVPATKGAWMDEMAELGMDHYWRIMIAVKSAGVVPGKIVGEALQVYADRWLTNMAAEVTAKHCLLLEKIVSLLPPEKGSVSCSFLLKLLKTANVLNASSGTKSDLARRAGVQLEEATVNDLLIPCFSNGDDAMYDVDAVITIVEEFMLQGRSPPTSPTREKAEITARRRSRSAERLDFEGRDNSRRLSSASHGSMLRVARLVDLYLREIAGDEKVPVEKVIALAEALPEFARTDHDDLYRVIDTYLRAHPHLEKKQRKKLCRVLDCKKLSLETSTHAAQNDMLPLRVVVQVLFFEQVRGAMAGAHVKEIPGNIKAALLTKAADASDKGAPKCTASDKGEGEDDRRSSAARLKCQAKTTKVAPSTLRMKLEEDDDDDMEDAAAGEAAMMRSSSSRFRALCSIPGRQRRILSKFWSVNRR